MNIKELIGKYEYLNHSFFRRVDTSEVLRDLKQLDEPEKIVVSEEEAKFLKTFDFNCESDVTKALYHVSRTGWGHYLTDNDGIELKDFSERFIELENRKRLIKAILDGYEVEKEPKYKVKVKNTDDYLNETEIGFHFFNNGKNNKEFTRKELEYSDFAWVLDCPGIELEEVTD